MNERGVCVGGGGGRRERKVREEILIFQFDASTVVAQVSEKDLEDMGLPELAAVKKPKPAEKKVHHEIRSYSAGTTTAAHLQLVKIENKCSGSCGCSWALDAIQYAV